MFRMIIAAVALVAVAGGAAFWAYDRGDDSAEAQVQVVRWFDVTVAIPEGSGLVPIQTYWQDDRPVLRVVPSYNASLGVVIDAKTGDLIVERVPAELGAVFRQVLATITVSQLDLSTAPWPYNGEPPKRAREEWGIFTRWANVTFIPPDPASGIAIRFVTGGGPKGAGRAIQLTNGQSTLSVNADTGAVYDETTTIFPEDQGAFERILSTIQFTERQE